MKTNADAFGGQALDEGLQGGQVASQAVEETDVQDVVLAQIVQAGLELGPLGVLGGGLLDEGLIESDAFKLAGRVLVKLLM